MRVHLAILWVTFSIASAAAQNNQAGDRVQGDSPQSTAALTFRRRDRCSPKAPPGRLAPLRAALLLQARKDSHLPACRRLLKVRLRQ
jgi:hypothetical protein